MTRIEKNLGLEQKVDDLKKEMIEVEKVEVKARGGHRWKLGCGILFLAVFLVTIGFVTWILTASGVVTVPVVSTLVYKVPTPLHSVSTGVPLEAYVSEKFGSILTSRLQSGSGSINDRSIEISLPESSITTSFRTILTDNKIGFVDATTAQVAIDEKQGIEIFLPLVNSSNGNALRFFLKLGSKDSRLIIDNTQIKIGNLTVPSWLSNLLIELLMKQGLDSLNQEIGRYTSIEKIETISGALKIFGTLTVEIIKIQ
ncbi:MAG: hypothetical protein WC560_12885 [Syntrophales bacterium]